MKKVRSDDGGEHLCLFATKDLQLGDELRYNYGTGKDLYWRRVSCHLVIPKTNCALPR